MITDATWSDAGGFVSARQGDFGLELEIEGENLPREVEGWLVKPEGSLRGKNGRTTSSGENEFDTPQEYVLYRPCNYPLLQKRVEFLVSKLQTPGTVVHLTPRASTHIHLNMTRESLRTLFGFTAIFTCIEPVLLRLCGPLRNGNLFCLPSYETGELADTISRMARCIATGTIRSHWPSHRGKYACLNLDPLTQFGSVEIRCFPNSINPTEILEWASWLLRIRDLAHGETETTYMDFLERSYNNPRQLLTQVFANADLFTACHPQSPVDLTLFGIEQAYEIAKAALPAYVEETKPASKKKRIPDEELVPIPATPAPNWDIVSNTIFDEQLEDELD